jgi:hypothetical protein
MGTIRTVLSANNWTSATRRNDACQGCVHAEKRQVGNITQWHCRKMGTWTSALAICDQLAIQPEKARHG